MLPKPDDRYVIIFTNALSYCIFYLAITDIACIGQDKNKIAITITTIHNI